VDGISVKVVAEDIVRTMAGPMPLCRIPTQVYNFPGELPSVELQTVQCGPARPRLVQQGILGLSGRVFWAGPSFRPDHFWGALASFRCRDVTSTPVCRDRVASWQPLRPEGRRQPRDAFSGDADVWFLARRRDSCASIALVSSQPSTCLAVFVLQTRTNGGLRSASNCRAAECLSGHTDKPKSMVLRGGHGKGMAGDREGKARSWIFRYWQTQGPPMDADSLLNQTPWFSTLSADQTQSWRTDRDVTRIPTVKWHQSNLRSQYDHYVCCRSTRR